MRSDPLSRRFDREATQRRANDVRARVRLSEVVGRVVALKHRGGEAVGLCPFHNEKTPSFTVNDKKRFYHCFGCGEHGDAIAFVMRRQGLEFPAALELLESENGLRHLQAAAPAPPPVKVAQREDLQKAEAIRRIWEQARPLVPGDPVDRYLRGRGLLPPAEYGFEDNVHADERAGSAGWPSSLRFAPELWHGEERRRMPGMVAAMRRPDGGLACVHRTYLKVGADGAVTKAGTGRDKAMLGPPNGSVILLAQVASAMAGAEGIETGFSVMQMFRRATLAFGSRAGMAATEPPFACSDFLYAADKNRTHKDPQRSRVGERAAWAGAKKFGAPMGRTVSVKVPNVPGAESADFNDVLVARLAQAGGSRCSEAKRREPAPSPLLEVPA